MQTQVIALKDGVEILIEPVDESGGRWCMTMRFPNGAEQSSRVSRRPWRRAADRSCAGARRCALRMRVGASGGENRSESCLPIRQLGSGTD